LDGNHSPLVLVWLALPKLEVGDADQRIVRVDRRPLPASSMRITANQPFGEWGQELILSSHIDWSPPHRHVASRNSFGSRLRELGTTGGTPQSSLYFPLFPAFPHSHRQRTYRIVIPHASHSGGQTWRSYNLDYRRLLQHRS